MKLFFFLLATSVVAFVIPPGKYDSVCYSVDPSPSYDNCNVDLTIAMDTGVAMVNTANIATMTESVLNDFIQNFALFETFTAGMTFGSTILTSQYINNYADICNFIHAAQEEATQLGTGSTSLSEVFQNYQINLQHSGRNYQKVLVLVTAKNDAAEIAAAKVYSDQLQTEGVVVILVGLAYATNTSLPTLGQYFYSSPDYTIPIATLPSTICSYGGITYAPPTVGPSSLPLDPLSNAIGTPCSENVANVWLDIVFVIDISNAMSTTDLNNLAIETLTYMNKVNFGPRGPHSTRAGLITYATESTTRLALSDGTDKATFAQEILKLPNYYNSDDNGGHLQTALKAAVDMFNATKLSDGPAQGIRQKIVILTAGAYNDIGFQGAGDTAQILKDNGVYLFTINYNSVSGFYVPGLDNLASRGYAYRSDQEGLENSLPLGLTQVNCFCPTSTLQFKLFDYRHNNYTTYADCFFVGNVRSLPSLANAYGCPKGSLVSVTSQEKHDFISDFVINATVATMKKYIVGAHKNVHDGQWYWSGYNKTEYPVGSFPVFAPAPGDTFSYLDNYFGFNWKLNGATDNDVLPFMCQNQACDADFICDQS